MAGYSKQMKELIESNPGLKSRMNYFIEFKDYSTEELLEILEYHVRLKSMSLGEEVKEWMRPYIDKARLIKDFGNGRFVVNLLEKAIVKQRLRLANGGLSELKDLSEEIITTLMIEDFIDIEKMLDDLINIKAPGTNGKQINLSNAEVASDDKKLRARHGWHYVDVDKLLFDDEVKN